MRVSKTSPDDPTACRSHTVRDINVRQQQDSAWKSEVGMMSAKKFSKPLDRERKTCYNNHVERVKDRPKNQKGIDTMTKMTYVQAINLALRALNGETINSREEVVEKLFALGLSLEKRNAHKSVKPTKKQSENAEIKQCIANYLAEHASAKCGEVATAVGISGQRCSALLSQMVEQGMVVKTTEKRVSLFSLADEDDPVQALPGELDA